MAWNERLTTITRWQPEVASWPDGMQHLREAARLYFNGLRDAFLAAFVIDLKAARQQFAAARYTQSTMEPLDVFMDRVHADSQPTCDLLLAVTLYQTCQHLPQSRRQRFGRSR